MENTFMIIKKKNIRTIVITCALLGIIIFSIHSYNVYMRVQRGKAFAMIFMDLDFFKPVNDIYGHPVGDEVLCNVGKRIINSIRTADYAFRIGGDEFACINRWKCR